MANQPSPPRPGSGPPRPSGSSPKARPSARPRPKGGKSWSPGGANSGPKKAPKAAKKVVDELVRDPPGEKPAGHLAMVPLNGKSDNTYDNGKGKGSATEFFAIPHAPKVSSAPAPPPGRPPAPGGPLPAGPIPGGPVPVGPRPVGGIQGPMVGGPVAAPLNYAGVPTIEEDRNQSTRVLAIVMALVLMVCVALLGAVSLVVFFVIQENKEPPLPEVVNKPVVVSAPEDVRDSGLNSEPKPPVKPPSRPRPKSTKPRPRSTPKPAAPKPEPNGSSAAGAAGTVRVTIPKDVYITRMEVNCPSASFRQRANFVNSTASLAGVPAVECTVNFKGGGLFRSLKTVGGKSFTCTGAGMKMVCR